MKTEKLITAFIVLVLCLWLPAGVFSQHKEEVSDKEVEIKITYCNLPLAESWKFGNLTFNALYSFKIDAGGKPFELKKIRDNFIGFNAVLSCINKWEIKGFSTSSLFVVSFKWKHGKGWVGQQFSGNGFTHTMRYSGVGSK